MSTTLLMTVTSENLSTTIDRERRLYLGNSPSASALRSPTLHPDSELQRHKPPGTSLTSTCEFAPQSTTPTSNRLQRTALSNLRNSRSRASSTTRQPHQQEAAPASATLCSDTAGPPGQDGDAISVSGITIFWFAILPPVPSSTTLDNHRTRRHLIQP